MGRGYSMVYYKARAMSRGYSMVTTGLGPWVGAILWSLQG